jgi:hypothetical protein
MWVDLKAKVKNITPEMIMGNRNPNIYNPKAAGHSNFNLSNTKQNFTNCSEAIEYAYNQVYIGPTGRGVYGKDSSNSIRVYYQWQ